MRYSTLGIVSAHTRINQAFIYIMTHALAKALLSISAPQSPRPCFVHHG